MADTNRPLPVEGRKTNNGAAPTTDNIGALVALANAAAPSFTEGRQTLLSVDLSGALRVSASIPAANDPTHLEDDPAVSGDRGSFMLAVRNSAQANLTSTDGDYSGVAVDAAGRVMIAPQQSEDAASSSGFIGVAVLAVRNDNQAAQTSTDGDFGAISVDSAGRLFARAEKAEDAAHTSGDTGSFVLGVRNDALAALTSTDLDYTPLATDSKGALWARLSTSTGAVSNTNPLPVTVETVAGTLVDSGQLSSASLAAGASVALVTADIAGTTGKLVECTASASVRLKVEVQTFTASTGTTKRTLFVESGEPFVYQPKDVDEITQAAGAGNKFRLLVTNMDAVLAADVYGSITHVEV